MNFLAATTVSLSLLASASSAAETPTVKVTRIGTQPSAAGPAEYFTGAVRIDSPFRGTEPARVGGATVTFAPGARTAWRRHPLGQTLIVTAGAGVVQQWGESIQEIKPGDVVWIPPGVKHWHGAAAGTAMSTSPSPKRWTARWSTGWNRLATNNIWLDPRPNNYAGTNQRDLRQSLPRA